MRGQSLAPGFVTVGSPPSAPAGVRGEEVRRFWEEEACGERSAVGEDARRRYAAQAAARYAAEPYIHPFARFVEGAGKDVLEVGVGMGADHAEWARSGPRRLAGVDLTERAVAHTAERLALEGRASELRVADAEALPFPDASFDLVYSWGVVHHAARPQRVVDEIRRVLRPGGVARVMLYRRGGLCWRLLWAKALLSGAAPRSLDEAVSRFAESPGTRVYSEAQARELFDGFASVTMTSTLTMGDLLVGPMGRRHGGRLLDAVRRVWPRPLIHAIGPCIGSDLLVEARR